MNGYKGGNVLNLYSPSGMPAGMVGIDQREYNIVAIGQIDATNQDWLCVPSSFRLNISGTGALSIDVKENDDSIINGKFSYSFTAANNTILEFLSKTTRYIRLNPTSGLIIYFLG